MTGREQTYVAEAFATNWIAPAGPHLEAFEREFCEVIGSKYAVATSSGTAALHLALLVAGVAPGDEVLVSTFTFVASVNPILYAGARPTFVDSETASWNMDPELLSAALEARARQGRLPKAVVLVHMLGQSADLSPIKEACARYDVALVEDAAEALGATYRGRKPGSFGQSAAFSFNGNKIITTSGGGMLVSDDAELIERARKLATQARDAGPHYEHSQVGFNYRLSNISAGIGRGQLSALEDYVTARRRNFAFYERALAPLPGIAFQPEAPWGRHSRWLTAITIDPDEFGADRETVRLALADANIESRPVWKPMHQQPLFAGCEAIGGAVADTLFERGLCLPSGSSLTETDLSRVVDVIGACTNQTLVARMPSRVLA
jgi:dTDP-4-amino-4,6-dideoxygalactose transaminase